MIKYKVYERSELAQIINSIEDLRKIYREYKAIFNLAISVGEKYHVLANELSHGGIYRVKLEIDNLEWLTSEEKYKIKMCFEKLWLEYHEAVSKF